MRRFGDRDSFAVEVGPIEGAALRIVDLWPAGEQLTTDDNVDYMPSPRRAAPRDAIDRRAGTPRRAPSRVPSQAILPMKSSAHLR